MIIKIDDLRGEEIALLLAEHLADMHNTSPAESVHALDVQALKASNITFFSGWIDDQLAGCIAIKMLSDTSAELKSMRTAHRFRGQGVAAGLLRHCLDVAKTRGVSTVYLETGTQPYFEAAHRLYKKHGFKDCGPFGNYIIDANSRFMVFEL